MSLDVVGLGNAIMDALVRIEDDALIGDLGLTRGQMHPVNHARWHEVYNRVKQFGVEVHSGGSCANAMATAALLGGKVLYCGQVGDDRFGELYAESLIASCGDHRLHVEQGAVTGKCLSLISRRDGERTMLTDLGSAIELHEIGSFIGHIQHARVFHLTGYKFLGGPVRDAAYRALAVAQAAQVPISIDLADPFVARNIRDEMEAVLRKYATIAFLNREEAEAMTGLGAVAALEVLEQWVDVVVVKLGSEGSLVRRRGQTWKIPVFPARVMDTTGAGDSYAGAFLYAWSRGLALPYCGELGSRVAALTVGQVGAVCRDREALAGALTALNLPGDEA